MARFCQLEPRSRSPSPGEEGGLVHQRGSQAQACDLEEVGMCESATDLVKNVDR